MVARRPLAEELSDALLHDILSGTFAPGTILPSETELAERSGMSRLTVREAIKDLRSKRVVEVNQGRGTFVNQPSEWSALDPVLLIARSSYGEDTLELERQFLEARRTVEVQIARMAATRRTDLHQKFLDALSGGGPDSVAMSMHDHLMQTEEDLGTYVRDSAQSLSAVRRGSTHGGIDSLPTARSTSIESASLSWGPHP